MSRVAFDLETWRTPPNMRGVGYSAVELEVLKPRDSDGEVRQVRRGELALPRSPRDWTFAIATAGMHTLVRYRTAAEPLPPEPQLARCRLSEPVWVAMAGSFEAPASSAELEALATAADAEFSRVIDELREGGLCY